MGITLMIRGQEGDCGNKKPLLGNKGKKERGLRMRGGFAEVCMHEAVDHMDMHAVAGTEPNRDILFFISSSGHGRRMQRTAGAVKEGV